MDFIDYQANFKIMANQVPDFETVRFIRGYCKTGLVSPLGNSVRV